MDSSTANDANIPVEDSRSCTNFTVAKISHTWTIRNFSFCKLKVGEFLQSVTFPLTAGEEHDKTEWCMRVYPKGHSEKTKEYSVFILLPTKHTKLKAECTMGTVNEKGARLALQPLTSSNTFGIDGLNKFATLVKQNDLLNKTSEIMQGDNLVLFCEIQVLTDISNTLENLNVIKYTDPKSHLLAKIGQLFETKKFSDVTITVGETKFQAHKNILAAQSPKLSAMLEHYMEETKQKKEQSYIGRVKGGKRPKLKDREETKQTKKQSHIGGVEGSKRPEVKDREEKKQTKEQSCIGGVEGGKRPEPNREEFPIITKKRKQCCIDMTGIDDKVVKKMLLFLYTGTVNNINENTVGLLAAANKYTLQELKIMCEEALRISLSVQNAAYTLVQADRHSADQLKSQAISFICSHAEDVVTTDGFKAMILAQPSLLAELFCRMAQKNNGDSNDASETDASASKSNASATNTP